jgi:glyoxylase-like metal-dependent hydrolase (beta-lactamase superfamily II)
LPNSNNLTKRLFLTGNLKPFIEAVILHTKQINENLFLVDLQTGGFRNLIASYLIKGKQTIIVETGPTSSIPNLILALKETNVKPEDVSYVALSHIHVDHGGGVGTLLKTLPNAKVIVHPRGAPNLINPDRLWVQTLQTLGNVAEIFGVPEPVSQDRIVIAADGMKFDVGAGIKLIAIETLGHAAHHLSYHLPIYSGIFPGDAAGIYLREFEAVIPTSPPPFRLDIALASLENLIAFKPKLLYYTHFGEASDAVERLRRYAQQLKHWMNIVKDGLGKDQSPSIIRERILAEDVNMRKMVNFLRSHPIYSKTAIGNSVQGFLDFAGKTRS